MNLQIRFIKGVSRAQQLLHHTPMPSVLIQTSLEECPPMEGCSSSHNSSSLEE